MSIPLKSGPLKLGTRRSLLAMTQSAWVAHEIERKNPGIKIELIPIDTKGDQILDKPLQEVAGKDFFVAELDQALLREEIDFTVHSLKDLSLTRPRQIVQAAVPPREAAHDVLIFSHDALARARAGKSIRIGTSSPRRLENLPGFLKDHFPVALPATKVKFEWTQIRGNVGTRIKRLVDPEPSKKIEAVCLALAGINRLWKSAESRAELAALLKEVAGPDSFPKVILLPLGPCPTAPGQGALSVECLARRQDLIEIIAKTHHEATAQAVAVEREILAASGGGCHARFGATQVKLPSFGELTLVTGKLSSESEKRTEETRWTALPVYASRRPQPPKSAKRWNGNAVKPEITPRTDTAVFLKELTDAVKDREWVLLTHPLAVRHLPAEALPLLAGKKIATSGLSTWTEATARGLWVAATSESFGPDWLDGILTPSFLSAPPLSAPKAWVILTFDEAVAGWQNTHPGAHPIAVYKSSFSAHLAGKTVKTVTEATHFFWTSPHQYRSFKNWVPEGAHHASGAGRTWQALNKEGLECLAFPSVKDWENWLS